MAENTLGIVDTLFGVTPTQQSDMNYAIKNLSGLSASQIGGAQLYAAGKGLGRGLMQAAGVEDPEMAASNKLKAAAAQVQQQGLDPKTSAGMKAVANIIQQSGDTATAMKAMVVANQLEQDELAKGLTKAQTTKITQEQADKAKMREELAALPSDATDADYMAIYRKYGGADVGMRTIEAGQYHQAALAQKQQALDTKAQQAKESQIAQATQGISAATNALQTVREAIPMVGYTTAGIAGGTKIWGTEAADLQAKLDTIKSNLGLDKLAQMKQASKTGASGLGSLAVKELEALQASVASLDRTQSPTQLSANLKKIEQHYINYISYMNGQIPGGGGATPTREAQARKTIKFSDMP